MRRSAQGAGGAVQFTISRFFAQNKFATPKTSGNIDSQLPISTGGVAARRQCSIAGAGDPSDQLPTQNMKTVTRS